MTNFVLRVHFLTILYFPFQTGYSSSVQQNRPVRKELTHAPICHSSSNYCLNFCVKRGYFALIRAGKSKVYFTTSPNCRKSSKTIFWTGAHRKKIGHFLSFPAKTQNALMFNKDTVFKGSLRFPEKRNFYLKYRKMQKIF